MTLRMSHAEYDALMQNQGKKERVPRPVKMQTPILPSVYFPDEDRIVIYLPLPARELDPNVKSGRFKRTDVVKEAREYACAVTREALKGAKPGWTAVTGFRRWFLPRMRDRDNLAIWPKSFVDGIADTGLFTNDRVIVWAEDEIETSRTNQHLEIELRKRNI